MPNSFRVSPPKSSIRSVEKPRAASKAYVSYGVGLTGTSGSIRDLSFFYHKSFVTYASSSSTSYINNQWTKSYFGNQWINYTNIIINGKIYFRDESTGGPYMGPCKGVCKGQVFIGGANITSDKTGCFGSSDEFHGIVTNGVIYFVNKTNTDLVLTVKKHCIIRGVHTCPEQTFLVPACGSSNSTYPNWCEVCYVWEPAQYGTINKNYNTECLLDDPCPSSQPI